MYVFDCSVQARRSLFLKALVPFSGKIGPFFGHSEGLFGGELDLSSLVKCKKISSCCTSFIYIIQRCETAILREKKSGNFGIFGHGKPGKVREIHLPEVLTTLKEGGKDPGKHSALWYKCPMYLEM